MTGTGTILLGCIADDFTGAADLASMLVSNGMRTIQTIGIPASGDCDDVDAVVIALKTRTVPAEKAVSQSLEALQWLQTFSCRQYLFKYCSTFDSTPAGNIGPVAEALGRALETEFFIACPAFPANGRTVYQGHLFVGNRLLSESGMRNHPLTPMRDSDLVRVLQEQIRGMSGLIAHEVIAQGSSAIRHAIQALRREGVTCAIADAIDDRDLLALGQACADHRLITGGSGIAMGLPENFRQAGLLKTTDADRLPRVEGRRVVLSGSASLGTNEQVVAWKQAGGPAFRIDPMQLAEGRDNISEAVVFALQAETPVLIFSTPDTSELASVQESLGAGRAGELVEAAMAAIAVRLRQNGFRNFVVAGGETSGAVVQVLDVRKLRIGPCIAPGVPLTVSVGDDPFGLVLKSGNFGDVAFFSQALEALEQGHAA